MELRTVPGNFGLLKRFIRSVMTPSILFSSNFSAMGACGGRRPWLFRCLWRKVRLPTAIWRLQPTRLPLQMKEKRPVSTQLGRGR